jgi:hypothetical protein
MGMDRTISFPSGPPSWPAVLELLGQRGVMPKIQMIDGELAFPDEVPTERWQELRLAVPGGTVTVRRAPDKVVCVVWGNADATLRQSWETIAQAFAEVGAGTLLPPPEV